MKKQIAVLLVMGAMFSGYKVYANGNNNSPSVNPAKSMQVSFDNVSADSKLYIKDSEGHILYTENIHSEGKYKRGFDFSALPSNEYFFEVDKEAFISVYPFTVVDDFVVLHEDLRSEIVKPVLVQEDNRVKLMRNHDQKQSVEVEIYYQGRDLIFSETINTEVIIGRSYDLSASASGEYLFRIKYEDRSYSEYLSINTIY